MIVTSVKLLGVLVSSYCNRL